MRRRSRSGGEPAKTRRRKTLKRRNAAKAVVRRSSIAGGQETEAARLARELNEVLEQQKATSEVLRVISSSPTDAKPVFDTIAKCVVQFCRAQHSMVFRFDGTLIYLAGEYGYTVKGAEVLRGIYPIAPGRASAAARAILSGTVSQVPDIDADPDYAHSTFAKRMNFHSIAAVPMFKDGRPVGAIAITKAKTGLFPEQQIEIVRTFAAQAVIAIENVRLFDEIQDKNRQLEEASQHKSQFLANMSHELRTPLNAILGYTELILDQIYGDTPDKMRTVLTRIQSNSKHLLGLINDVLDLSKIEAGQLTLSLSDYSLKDVIQTVFSAIQPLATEKKIALKIDVAPQLPPGHGDERRLTQVLLNLVGNAIKFTDVGEVSIKGSSVNGAFNVSVCDTGPGISPADQAKLFEEFQQADNSITKQKGGTGLGLAISKRIIELHGGRIWLESDLGHGSTFAFTLPVTVEKQARPT
jgi:signal transduction histidine kinase